MSRLLLQQQCVTLTNDSCCKPANQTITLTLTCSGSAFKTAMMRSAVLAVLSAALIVTSSTFTAADCIFMRIFNGLMVS